MFFLEGQPNPWESIHGSLAMIYKRRKKKKREPKTSTSSSPQDSTAASPPVNRRGPSGRGAELAAGRAGHPAVPGQTASRAQGTDLGDEPDGFWGFPQKQAFSMGTRLLLGFPLWKSSGEMFTQLTRCLVIGGKSVEKRSHGDPGAL